MDPLKKPVPSGLKRPVKKQGLTHACWLESARQLDQPRTWWDRVKQKTSMQRANTQIPLRSSSPASSEAQPDHCRKDVQKVGSQRHSQWRPLSKHRESHLQSSSLFSWLNLWDMSSSRQWVDRRVVSWSCCSLRLYSDTKEASKRCLSLRGYKADKLVRLEKPFGSFV